ncbi:MAG: SusD/RagB family nutrient-binding outer membrane lipoprotein [Flammeovirgaceae bacterium]|nr:SusD/RagB family nutrient-binding outer membrane lipoprotein [Flammeovirgaceae bacterium]
MKRIFKLKFLLLFTSFWVFSSCEFDEEINVDPSTPADVTLNAIWPAAQTGISWVIGGEIVRINGLLIQHFNGINAQQASNTQYLIRDADMDGMWRRMYHDSLNPLVDIIKKANEQDSPFDRGKAKVLLALGLGNFTDGFGDIPYVEAFKADDDLFAPTYNSQQEIYNTIQTLLDEAIADLEGPAGTLTPGYDRIFENDLGKWVKAANSLKARYALHLEKKNGSQAFDDALTLLSEGISSNTEDFEFIFGTASNEPNPQYQFSQDRGGNIEMGEFLIDQLESKNDPRTEFFREQSTDSDGNITDNKVFGSGSFYTKIDAPVVLMSYVEAKFIEAEAHLRKATPDLVASETAFKAAVSSSILKITGATDDAYIANYATYAGLATPEARLERLMTEKYIAMYSQGIESWTDYRRTGFPILTPNPNGSNGFNLNGEIPRRLPYPQTEVDLNPKTPITSPNLQTPVWWDE